MPLYTDFGYFAYLEGKLYLLGARDENYELIEGIHVYDIDEKHWSFIDIKGSNYHFINSVCAYEDSLYIYKFDSTLRLNLHSKELKLEVLDIDLYGSSQGNYGYVCNENLVYIFGGYDQDDSMNGVWSMDLALLELKFENLSKNMQVPTARSGHAMEVYNDKLYIVGGTDKHGQK